MQISTSDIIAIVISDVMHLSTNDIMDESNFRTDFMADNLDMFELFNIIENIFHISISCSAIDNIITFRDLVDYVSCTLNNKENNTMCKKYVIHERQLNMLKSIYNAYKECGLHNYWLEDIISDIEKQEIVDEDSSEDIA